MRHRKARNILSRSTKQREALLRSLVRSLFLNDSIRTTLARAKEVRRHAEKLITLGKNNSVSSRRKAFQHLNDRDVVKSLFDEISPRFRERAGGYTRILRLGNRQGDGAQMAILELVAKRPAKPKKKLKEEVKEAPKAKPAEEAPKPAPAKPKKEEDKGFFGSLRNVFRKKQDTQE